LVFVSEQVLIQRLPFIIILGDLKSWESIFAGCLTAFRQVFGRRFQLFVSNCVGNLEQVGLEVAGGSRVARSCPERFLRSRVFGPPDSSASVARISLGVIDSVA